MRVTSPFGQLNGGAVGRSEKEALDREHQLVSHRLGTPRAPKGALCLPVLADPGQAQQQKALPHHSHHRMVAVDGGGDAADETQLARPLELLATIGADVAHP